jgi:hypothetical protein
MSTSRELVIMHDAYKRMQNRSAHISGVIVDTVYLKNLLHGPNV